MSFRNLLEELKYFRDLHAKHEGWYSEVLMRILRGDGLKEIAATYNCNFSPLREFIRENDEREAEYQSVLEKKREFCSEELLNRTAKAAFASVQDALTGDGGTLDIAQWPEPLVAACDAAEFGPTGQIYKIKMDAGKHGDRLARMLGMDKSGQTNINVTSLVSVLSEMPAGAIRQRPGAQAIEDATYSGPKLVAEAPESAEAATPAGKLLPEGSPGQSVDIGI